MLQTERLGERAELVPLAGIDGLEPTAEACAPPRLHLADHERATAGDHQVQLADPAPPVASHHAVPTREVVPLHGGLAAPSDRGALVHGPTIWSWADMPALVEIADGTPIPEKYAAFRAHVRWPAVDPAQAAEGLRASLASVLAR